MKLSQAAEIADVLCNDIAIHFQNAEFESYLIMSTNLHGILILNNQDAGQNAYRNVGPLHATTLHLDLGRLGYSEIFPKPKTISTIVKYYKLAVTLHCNRLGLENGWHQGFTIE